MSNESKSMAVPEENKMGVMPVGRLLFSMSLPMMLSMLVQALYNIVDSISSMQSMGSVTDDGDLIVGYVSKGDYVDVNPDSEFIVSVNMSFKQGGDAADYIEASLDPNLFFVVDDIADNNYDDEYSLVESFDGYKGSLALMTCDISPTMTENAYDVSGQIKIATDINGGSTTAGIVGITVNVLDGGDIIASEITDENGYYNLVGIPAGTYEMLITGPTTIDRRVTLNVAGSKQLDSVGIVICDYNHDGDINAADKSTFLYSFTGDYNVYCDFNADGDVNAADKSYFLVFFNKAVDYDNVTLY